ncbi:hypothetical protein C8J57DRAFT_1269911 [Mycena rebaudengoi]|nr:hypothetical protein C8J57DRAFT_1269911 [Mycena rebaudengoi]
MLSRYSKSTYASFTAESQLIENWIKWAGTGPTPSRHLVLLAENEMGQLLMLAHHPRIALKSLHSLSSWHYSFGWDVRMCALSAYIFFNVVLSQPKVFRTVEQLRDMESYNHVIRLNTESRDFDAEAIPHREFFGTYQQRDNFDPLADMERLKQYLKLCFELLYRYDMLARECGVHIKWEGAIAETVSSLWGVAIDYVEEDGSSDRFTHHFVN